MESIIKSEKGQTVQIKGSKIGIHNLTLTIFTSIIHPHQMKSMIQNKYMDTKVLHTADE